MIEETISYRTSDGEVFASRSKAETHERRVLLRELIERLGIGQGGSWSARMIADTLLEHESDLVDILRPSAPRLVEGYQTPSGARPPLPTVGSGVTWLTGETHIIIRNEDFDNHMEDRFPHQVFANPCSKTILDNDFSIWCQDRFGPMYWWVSKNPVRDICYEMALAVNPEARWTVYLSQRDDAPEGFTYGFLTNEDAVLFKLRFL